MKTTGDQYKYKVQKHIAFVSVLLLGGKIIAWQLTNSVSILTDALESIVNVVAGFVSLYSIKVALLPKDKNHPFGHGKIEYLSASFEGLLILVAGIFIIYEAVKRLFIPTEIKDLDIGILIVAVAGLINYILGSYSIANGKKYNSIALISGGKHLHSDTYSTIGLTIGLVILYFTGLTWLDSAIAVIFGTIIIYTGYKILRETTANLMDEADFLLLKRISNVLWQKRTINWIELSQLRLLKNGNTLHLYGNLTLPWFMNISEAHREIDLLEAAVSEIDTHQMEVSIHADVCTINLCGQCLIESCIKRASEFRKAKKWKA